MEYINIFLLKKYQYEERKNNEVRSNRFGYTRF